MDLRGRGQGLRHRRLQERPERPLRALDGKLADALARIAKGEPARRIAIEAERAALSADLLSSRQTLWMIYKDFELDDAATDHIAYEHLESMTFSGKDDHRVKSLEQDTAYYRIQPNARYGPA